MKEEGEQWCCLQAEPKWAYERHIINHDWAEMMCELDFIELSPCEGNKYCLVLVDMWSKRVEAFPTSKQDAAAVEKALLTEIVPRWGIPQKISSDNRTHFVNEAIKEVGTFLGIKFENTLQLQTRLRGRSRMAKRDN